MVSHLDTSFGIVQNKKNLITNYVAKRALNKKNVNIFKPILRNTTYPIVGWVFMRTAVFPFNTSSHRRSLFKDLTHRQWRGEVFGKERIVYAHTGASWSPERSSLCRSLECWRRANSMVISIRRPWAEFKFWVQGALKTYFFTFEYQVFCWINWISSKCMWILKSISMPIYLTYSITDF